MLLYVKRLQLKSIMALIEQLIKVDIWNTCIYEFAFLCPRYVFGKKLFIPCNVNIYIQKWYEIWGEIECYFKGVKESKVSKFQSKILLLISALFFQFCQ